MAISVIDWNDVSVQNINFLKQQFQISRLLMDDDADYPAVTQPAGPIFLGRLSECSFSYQWMQTSSIIHFKISVTSRDVLLPLVSNNHVADLSKRLLKKCVNVWRRYAPTKGNSNGRNSSNGSNGNNCSIAVIAAMKQWQHCSNGSIAAMAAL